MSSLSTIPGIGKTSLDLLEAAGFLNVEALARVDVEELARELERANDVLHIAKNAPSKSSVAQWIVCAREITGEREEPPVAVTVAVAASGEPVNFEASEEVAARLATAPLAIPLPARHLMDHQVAVSEIPPALLLNRYSGDLEVRVDDGREKASAPRPIAPPAPVPVPRAPLRPAGSPKAASGPLPENDRVALIRAPLEKTNRGKSPKSRRYVRGVLHSHPVSMTFGAFVTLLLAAALPLGIVSAALLLLSDQMPEQFEWVPRWILVFPVSLPVLGLIYAIWGAGASCRICGQKLFMPKACRKNLKAHHIPGLGHIVPVCLHILLFRWFRCTFCGTAVRLKK